MVALRRTLAVNCRRCGRSAERVRRADDLRSAAQLQQSGRCGFCRARACDGDVEIVPVEAPVNKRPGLILEEDGELHPRSWRNGGIPHATPILKLASSSDVEEPAAVRRNREMTARIVQGVLLGGFALAAAAVVLCLVLQAVNLVAYLGGAAARTISQVLSPPAYELSYDFSNQLERDAYCHAREYLIDVRGANVPEATRELRRNVIKHCPDLAAKR